jgi:hypothetical protein
VERRMEQSIAGLLKECIRLESEWKTFTAMLILLDPPSEVRKYFGGEMFKIQSELKDDVKKMGGVDEVVRKHRLTDEGYAERLSQLAENLDEVDFNIAEFESQVSAEQFSWLKSHIGKIKIALKGKIV